VHGLHGPLSNPIRPHSPSAAVTGVGSAAGEQAWLEVIKKMDEVYHELLDYEAALEQKNAALEESQQFIFSVLTSMSDVLIVCNRAGVIEDLNPSLLELTGRTEKALRGSSLLDLFADPDSRRTMEAHLAAHAGEPLADRELQLLGAGGQAVPVALSCTPRFSSGGRSLGLVVTGRPVGELRRAYTALREAHDDLKRTQQQLLHSEKMASLGRLVAGVAHELNNPISFVLGNVVALRKYLGRIGSYLQAVHATALPPEVAALRTELGIDRLLADLPSLIDGTLEGAERTRDVVDGLKRFSATGAEAPQALDLAAVIGRAVQWVGRAAPASFEVRTQLPAAIEMTGNAGQLQQVVMNLIQNAADATAGLNPGVLAIGARLEPGCVTLTFADNGPGIAADNLAKIFDPFFTTKPVGKGTGLGLSISYGIVERHGGHLSAANGPSGGAVITLSLPLRTAPGP
jgi:two-component system sensor histidine kinase HupT/HoxJ